MKTPVSTPTLNLADASLSQIAQMIENSWGNVNYAARPYLDAMHALNTLNDKYINDDGSSIVAYFLSNASSYHGPIAKEIKKELNKRLNAFYKAR